MVMVGRAIGETSVPGAPRWRALALAFALAGTLWGTGFAAGRLTTSEEPTAPMGSVELSATEHGRSMPVSVRPGRSRGQVRFGPSADEQVLIRPGDHGGGRVKGG